MTAIKQHGSTDEVAQAALLPAFEATFATDADGADCMMSPDKPEDWPHLFEQHLNAGDLEAVVALYEPDARFVARSSAIVVGRDRIRPVLAALIGTKTRLQSRVIKAVTVGDVALLYTDFQGVTVDASGKTADLHHKAIEVLRCQPKGAWQLIVGDPNGRE